MPFSNESMRRSFPGDLVDITKKPYAIEKYAHLLHTLHDIKNPLIYNMPSPNPVPSPPESHSNDYYSFLISNLTTPKQAFNKESRNMTEWTFHDDETWLNDLDQPPELLMSQELRNLEAQALMGETQVVGQPPPKCPGQGLRDVSWTRPEVRHLHYVLHPTML